MRKALNCVTACWMVVSILIFSGSPVSALETESWIPRIEILTPGVSRTFAMTQAQNFPMDLNHFLVFAIGYGPLAISLSRQEADGDFLVLTGAGISSAGIEPVFKYGVTKARLTAYVEIGNESSPYGFLWISCWVYSLVNAGPYTYTLQLSF